jgi:hypothetical protein
VTRKQATKNRGFKRKVRTGSRKIARRINEMFGEKEVRRASTEVWTPVPEMQPEGTQWRQVLTADEKEEYLADFQGTKITFELWPDERGDLEKIARAEITFLYGTYADTLDLTSVTPNNDAAHAARRT